MPHNLPRIIAVSALLSLLVACGNTQTYPHAAQVAVTPASAPTNPPTVAAPPTAAHAVAAATPGNIYLALGDSVTYGLGASLPGRTNFAGLLYTTYLRQLPQTSRFENLAISGETGQSFIDGNGRTSQLSQAVAQIDAAKSAGLTIGPVTLMIGANDLLNTRGQTADQRDTALATYERNLNTILDRLHDHLAAYPTANLILVTYYNPYGGDARDPNSDAAWSERLNAVIRKAATDRRLRLADPAPAFVGHTDTLTWIAWGDVHPTDSGHALIARSVWQASGYDTTPPTVRLVYPKETTALHAGGTNPTRLALKITVSDNVSLPPTSISLRTDDGNPHPLDPIPSAPDTYSTIFDTTALAPGAHTVTITATDAAGNPGTLTLPLTVE